MTRETRYFVQWKALNLISASMRRFGAFWRFSPDFGGEGVMVWRSSFVLDRRAIYCHHDEFTLPARPNRRPAVLMRRSRLDLCGMTFYRQDKHAYFTHAIAERQMDLMMAVSVEYMPPDAHPESRCSYNIGTH